MEDMKIILFLVSTSFSQSSRDFKILDLLLLLPLEIQESLENEVQSKLLLRQPLNIIIYTRTSRQWRALKRKMRIKSTLPPQLMLQQLLKDHLKTKMWVIKSLVITLTEAACLNMLNSRQHL